MDIVAYIDSLLFVGKRGIASINKKFIIDASFLHWTWLRFF